MNKQNLLKGTAILTVAGLLTRLLGFFYRIYLSNALGAERLGIYQLIFPLYGICFTIYASGLQTAISQLTAAQSAKEQDGHPGRILAAGLSVSLLCSLTLSAIVWSKHTFIAEHLLLEPECAQSLRILAYVFPFCGITACINGYFYGLKNASVPAATQFLEQVVRIVSVYAMAVFIGGGNMSVTVEIAVAGVVLGEIASNLYNLAWLARDVKKRKKEEQNRTYHPSSAPLTDKYRNSPPSGTSTPDGRPSSTDSLEKYCNPSVSSSQTYKKLLGLSVPLTLNRLLINMLHSFEAVLIPGMLRRFGLSSSEALSVYGILNGMAMPFLLFPGTITNSLSVLLLPAISEAQAVDNRASIKNATGLSIRYSLIIGIFSTGIFLVFGRQLGITVFGNETAGDYLTIMAWLCPMLYTATTLGSIINGLGKAHITFLNSVIGQSLRLALLYLLIPRLGITGYFAGTMISQIIITALDFGYVVKLTDYSFDWIKSLIKPTIAAFVSCALFVKLYEALCGRVSLPRLILMAVCCLGMGLLYLGMLVFGKVLSKEELNSR